MEYELELNDYIDHQDDILGTLDRIQSDLYIERVRIIVDGCKARVVRRIKLELENMGLDVTVEYHNKVVAL